MGDISHALFARIRLPPRLVAFAWATLAWAALAGAGCESSPLRISGGLSSARFVETFDGKPSEVELGRIRLRSGSCTDIDLKPTGRVLEADDFAQFVKSQGVEARVVRARQDLVYVDVANAGTAAPIRFRVATLTTSGAAGHELHTALLQQGQGSWGLHRSNLAVLAPAADPDDVVVLAGKLHLACWGVLMIAGHDDTFVVPGGYTEL